MFFEFIHFLTKEIALMAHNDGNAQRIQEQTWKNIRLDYAI